MDQSRLSYRNAAVVVLRCFSVVEVHFCLTNRTDFFIQSRIGAPTPVFVRHYSWAASVGEWRLLDWKISQTEAFHHQCGVRNLNRYPR